MEPTPRPYRTEAERRRNLRRLDDLLEALERLNLAEATTLPLPVRERLEREGISCDSSLSFSRLIELVWEKQEKYLIDLKTDRRKGPRRASDLAASQRVLDAFLLGRLNLGQRRRRRALP